MSHELRDGGHEAVVGLYLNRERQQMRRAAAVLLGIQQALGGINAETFAAVSETDDAGIAAFNEYQANRELNEDAAADRTTDW